ncbi:siphovirus ReqiPepy6 Gp37-like family protein [Lactococcus garvieae]|nr:siphovirus ReqiPepy6 Gp37-like family protein [Lactococcus garvieae]
MIVKRELTIEIFSRKDNFTFQSQGFLDSFKSCIVNWRAYNFDLFQLNIPWNTSVLKYLTPDNILSINDQFFYIETPSYDSSSSKFLTIKGKSLLGKASKRIIIPPYSTNSAKPEKIIYDLISKNITSTSSDKNYDYLSIETPPNLNTTALSYQNSYGDIASEVATLAENNQICIKEIPSDLESPKAVIQLYKGRDLSGDGGVEFDLDNGGLKTESFTRDISDMANVAYVFGEGEGSSRKNVVVYTSDTIPKGIDRAEIYVDARDLQKTYTDDNGKEITLTDAQYLEQLKQRGKQKLAEHAEIIQIGGEVNFDNLNFQYEKDYQVGDTVRVTNARFGYSKASILTEMQETWDESGYHLDPTFDKDRVSLTKIIKRK